MMSTYLKSLLLIETKTKQNYISLVYFHFKQAKKIPYTSLNEIDSNCFRSNMFNKCCIINTKNVF